MGEERTCLNCGKAFIPTCHITRQKYCSDTCRIRYNNAKRYYSGVPVNVCPECGEPIQQSGGTGRWRRFCSDRCRQRYHYKKNLEKRMRNWEPPKQICPNCGIAFQPEWGPGKQRRFCSDICRVTWWEDYHRANPTVGPHPAWCAYCGRELTGDQKKYCSRECCQKAMAETHEERVCQWCAETFSAYAGGERRFCSRNCAAAALSAPKGYQRGRHRIPAGDKESWHFGSCKGGALARAANEPRNCLTKCLFSMRQKPARSLPLRKRRLWSTEKRNRKGNGSWTFPAFPRRESSMNCPGRNRSVRSAAGRCTPVGRKSCGGNWCTFRRSIKCVSIFKRCIAAANVKRQGRIPP